MSRSTALQTARRGTVVLSLICFAISYIALVDLAQIAGQGPESYLWPVMVDGTIVVATVAAIAASDWHSWTLLVAAAIVSVIGNGIHAWITQGTWIAVGVALTPPVFLLWVTHLTVRLGTHFDETLGEPPAESQEAAPTATKRDIALQLVAQGDKSLRRIADELDVSDTTIRRWRDAANDMSDQNEIEPKSLVGVTP